MIKYFTALVVISVLSLPALGGACRKVVRKADKPAQTTQQKAAAYSRMQPNGIELEIDLEAVLPYLKVSEKVLLSALRDFLWKSDFREIVHRSVKDQDSRDVLLQTAVLPEVDKILEEMMATSKKFNSTGKKSVYKSEKGLAAAVKRFEDKFISEFSRTENMARRVFSILLIKEYESSRSRIRKTSLWNRIIEAYDEAWGIDETSVKALWGSYNKAAGYFEIIAAFKDTPFGKRAFVEQAQKEIAEALSEIDSRSIEGLEFLDTAWGKTLPRSIGRGRVSPRRQLAFNSYVEDRNPYGGWALTSGIEIHAISDHAPSVALVKLQDRVASIGANALADTEPLSSSHMHTMAPVNVNNFDKKHRLLYFAHRLEHGRRMELVAQMISVVDQGVKIINGGSTFSPLTIDESIEYFNALGDFILTDNQSFSDEDTADRSFGWVSLTGPNNYHKTSTDSKGRPNLFGYEYRPIILGQSSLSTIGTVLDQAKVWLHEVGPEEVTESRKFNSYFRKEIESEVKTILDKKYGKGFYTKMDMAALYAEVLYGKAYYLSDVTREEETSWTSSVHYNSKGYKGNRRNGQRRKSIAKNYPRVAESENMAVGMVFFNWSMDPLFYGNAKALEQIKKSQLKAKRRFKSDEDSIEDILRDFLVESGIYQAYLSSISKIQ